MEKISSFSNPLSIMVYLVVFVLFMSYSAFNVYEKHYYADGEGKQLYKAWHIALPGFTTIYYPEQEVGLRKWAGTKYNDFKAANKKDGQENPEATAGLALKAIDLFSDYELKEKNGHYILHRPERTERVFTTKAWYRIWKGKKR